MSETNWRTVPEKSVTNRSLATPTRRFEMVGIDIGFVDVKSTGKTENLVHYRALGFVVLKLSISFTTYLVI
jgi:hypothetical protein